MTTDAFGTLMAFLGRLEKARIPYQLCKRLEDAIRVQVSAPGEHWEVDFFVDGEIYVERFRSNGHIDDKSVLEELFALCSDEEPPVQEVVSRNDAASRE
ncbi:MAG TPA: hypothetical protein VG099_04060 [Gemmataceae bacterium]|jgi:hypothetical protein|nr:hypothetical protein [Gemmataceae bacterium]